jgi:hypothetical protein
LDSVATRSRPWRQADEQQIICIVRRFATLRAHLNLGTVDLLPATPELHRLYEQRM